MVDAGKHAVADKGENHRVRVERYEPAKGKSGSKVGLPKYQMVAMITPTINPTTP